MQQTKNDLFKFKRNTKQAVLVRLLFIFLIVVIPVLLSGCTVTLFDTPDSANDKTALNPDSGNGVISPAVSYENTEEVENPQSISNDVAEPTTEATTTTTAATTTTTTTEATTAATAAPPTEPTTAATQPPEIPAPQNYLPAQYKPSGVAVARELDLLYAVYNEINAIRQQYGVALSSWDGVMAYQSQQQALYLAESRQFLHSIKINWEWETVIGYNQTVGSSYAKQIAVDVCKASPKLLSGKCTKIGVGAASGLSGDTTKVYIVVQGI